MNHLFLKMLVGFQILIDREDGQDMIEYVLAASLIAFAAVASLRALAGGIGSSYSNLSTILSAKVN